MPVITIDTRIREKAYRLFSEGLGYKAVSTKLRINRETVREWGREFRNGEFVAEPQELARSVCHVMRADGRESAWQSPLPVHHFLNG